jgi:hypothetical protein
MTWTQQVWHVLRKDAWEQRLGVAGFVVTMAFVFVQSCGLSPAPLLTEMSGVTFTFLLAPGLAMAIVLADPPAGARAHWATLPLDRTAVWGAKALMLGMILLALVVSQVPALITLAPHVGETPAMLVQLLLPHAMSFGAVAALAGIVRDARALVLTVFLLMIAHTTVVAAIEMGLGGTDFQLTLRAITPTIAMLFAGASMLVLLAQYRLRRETTRMRATVLASVSILFLLYNARVPADAIPREIESGRVSGAQLVLLSDSAGSNLRPSMSGAFQLDGKPFEGGIVWEPVDGRIQPAAANPLMEMQRTTSGTSTRLWYSRGLPLRLSKAPLPIDPSTRWLDSETLTQESPAGVDQDWRGEPTTSRERAAPVGNTPVSGRLYLTRPRILLSTPLAVGATMARDGQRIAITEIVSGIKASVGLSVRMFGTSWEDSGRWAPAMVRHQFVLLNRSRGEAVELAVRGRAVSLLNWAVPMDLASRMELSLVADRNLHPTRSVSPRIAPVELAADWLHAAELVVVEWSMVGTAKLDVPIEMGSQR